MERSTLTLSFIWWTPTSGPLREGKVMSLSAEELRRGGAAQRKRCDMFRACCGWKDNFLCASGTGSQPLRVKRKSPHLGS